jgi:hypothetical protein
MTAKKLTNVSPNSISGFSTVSGFGFLTTGGEKNAGAFVWVKRGESARCRNGDLVISRNASDRAGVTQFYKNFG